jgi:hypothetical protein
LLHRDLPFFGVHTMMLLPFLDIDFARPLDDAGALFWVVAFFGSIVTLSLPKARGRTLYDLWSRTMVIGVREAELFYAQNSTHVA